MYTRHSQGTKSNREINLPGNYGGTAFRKDSIPEADETHELYSDEYDDTQEKSLATVSLSEQEQIREDKNAIPTFSNRLFPKEGGIGLEELLILGIILLVSQNSENDDDLSLLLLLLLFIR